MGYVLKAVLSSAQHPEYGQITVPFPIPDEKYDRMIELLEPLEIGDALRRDCRVDELDSFYMLVNNVSSDSELGIYLVNKGITPFPDRFKPYIN